MKTIDQEQLFETLLSKVMGAEKCDGYTKEQQYEVQNLVSSLIDVYSPRYINLGEAVSYKRIDKTKIKDWNDVLDMGISRYLQNQTPSRVYPYIADPKQGWGIDRIEWPVRTDISDMLLSHDFKPKQWANMVAHALLGCAYSRTPIDLGIKDDGDDLYLFHFIRISSDKYGARTHAYKLGRSKDPEKRRSALAGGSGCMILPVFILKGLGFLEPLVHKAMQDREMKDPVNEFYDDRQLLSLLACLALLFQKHTHQSLIEMLRDHLDVCAARFQKSSNDRDDTESRLHDSITDESKHPVVLAVKALFSAYHPSHLEEVDAAYLDEMAPMQDIELLQMVEGHSPLGVLAALLGYEQALGISNTFEGKYAKEMFKSVFGNIKYGLDEGSYWLCAIKGMPTLSFNAFVRLCTSFRFEVFRIWGGGEGHESTPQSTYRRKLGFLTDASFVKIMMELMPEVLRFAETKVDMFDICESIAKAAQDDQG